MAWWTEPRKELILNRIHKTVTYSLVGLTVFSAGLLLYAVKQNFSEGNKPIKNPPQAVQGAKEKQ